MLERSSRDAPSARVEENHREFEAGVARARRSLDAGKPLEAAVFAGVASNLATWMHPGLFASGDLERLTVDIGRCAAQRDGGTSGRPPRLRHGEIRKVLHVFSRTLTIGGHTRMVWRWMFLDRDRQHGVAVTRQGGEPIPRELVEAAAAAGGEVTDLSAKPGTLLSWARDLHELAASADVVILHVDPEDVIPAVAFADRSDLPPILYLNHADHLFWLGVGVSDLVVNLRYSGHLLSLERRGVPPERNAFVPIALGERERTMTRAAAKAALGYPQDTVLLLTIARAVKFEYRSGSGESYLDAVMPVVEGAENVRLVVVGPEPEGDFQRAHDATEGRITALGPRTDNEVLYQAADIYIDSYPQTSPTSMLEAGSYEVPLIALCPHSGAGAILCGDAPGIDDGLVRAGSVPEFQQRLRELIADPDMAAEIGAKTKSDIVRLHMGAGWKEQLEALFRHAVTTPPLLDVPPIGDTPHLGPPDTMIAMASPPLVEFNDLLAYHMRLLPLRARSSSWLRALRSGKRRAPTLLLSESAAARLKRLRARASRPWR